MKTIGPIIGGLIVLAILVFAATRSQHVLENGLPPREEFRDAVKAFSAAAKYAEAHGGSIIPIAGTGSMAPFIPPAPSGADPMETIVAFVVTRPGATFDDVTPGALCIYKPQWNKKGQSTMHQAALLTAYGWVMSGLHNERSESWEPMTKEKFTGIAAKAFVVVL